MTIDRKSKIPLYEQLKLLLQDQILLGVLAPGMLLPTELQLCQKYDISRITVRNALSELERSGLIERIQGRGSIVNNKAKRQSSSEVQGFTKSMSSQGERPYSELLEKNIIVANPALENHFNLPPNGNYLFWHFRRLRYFNNEPVVIMNHYVRKELGDKMHDYDLGNVSYYGLYQKILNQPLYSSDGLITAVQASPEVASVLKVKIGTALIWYRGIAYLEGHITVEVNYSLFLGDRFQFETKMFKPRNMIMDMELNSASDSIV